MSKIILVLTYKLQDIINLKKQNLNNLTILVISSMSYIIIYGLIIIFKLLLA
jgi:hypothetical protein